ncbi:helix-turn-helix domain-containing protein [Aquiflexum sp.]|uniref:helix-turn-helix domain-containing protein n=1 Tax=Aquiflexum sp. TaxID=1872584 RepID=UPI003593090A
MKLILNYNPHALAKKVIEKEIEKFGLEFSYTNCGQIEFLNKINKEVYENLKLNLLEYGIYVQENQQEQLIQRIKDVIDDFIFSEENYNYTTSHYISDKLNLSYNYISNIFSEMTMTTLQFYIILKKIDRAKTMLLSGEYKLNEISYKLNYSSVSHLSAQFKKITGLTASQFEKIVSKRNISLTNN